MKTIFRSLLVAGLALMGVQPVFAQASLAQTTLTTALAEPGASTPTTSVVIGSATCTNCRNGATVAAGDMIFIDKESMLVRSISSTTLTVTRGYNGTRPTGHLVSSLVWVGSPDDFSLYDAVGACTSTAQPILPRLNINTANFQVCDSTTGYWRGVSLQPSAAGGAWGRTPVAGTANYTILATDYIIGITTMTAARTFTLPTAVGLNGKTYVIVDESGAVSTSNTLTISGSFNVTHSAITVTTAFGSVRLYSNGARWFQW